MKKLPDEWEYEGVLVRRANLSDVDVLNSICKSWEDKIISEGEPFPESYIKNCILYGDLPPVKETDLSKYALMVITESEQAIGFFDLYHGYPQQHCVWISIFVIAKKYRQKHYGQKVISSIIRQIAENGFKCSGISVSLKNWRALRFWSKNGFSRIGGIYGDKDNLPGACAFVRLYNDLDNIKNDV